MADAFRRFRVARKLRESSVITSFHLVPETGEIWPYRPGQYLTLRIPGPQGPVLRTYSLSMADGDPGFHRISVKREDKGIGSGWLHDSVAEGDVIEAAAPRGSFVLDEDSSRPVLLLAGGVGLTPLLAMLHRLAPSGRKVWFLHAVENGEVQALRDEAASLAAASDGRIVVKSILRSPTAADRGHGRVDAEGVIDKPLLQSLLPIDDYDVYLAVHDLAGPDLSSALPGVTDDLLVHLTERRVGHPATVIGIVSHPPVACLAGQNVSLRRLPGAGLLQLSCLDPALTFQLDKGFDGQPCGPKPRHDLRHEALVEGQVDDLPAS